ncbi:MAG: hypothetical protein IT365_11815 [Candidatus Hydrogenedentes bacterium]|nr:hypothetical protein [Candidatus Hydrogenedentota bacterium]
MTPATFTVILGEKPFELRTLETTEAWKLKLRLEYASGRQCGDSSGVVAQYPDGLEWAECIIACTWPELDNDPHLFSATWGELSAALDAALEVHAWQRV